MLTEPSPYQKYNTPVELPSIPFSANYVDDSYYQQMFGGVGFTVFNERESQYYKPIMNFFPMTESPEEIRNSDGYNVGTIDKYNASNVNAQASLNQKLRTLKSAQNKAVRIENIADGRVRYYGAEEPSNTPGPTRGGALVTEHNENTGQVRTWYENYDHDGNVIRVHPKQIDGQDLDAQHYPPTGKELASWRK
ncbi:MAG: hypothetical protein AAF195_04125 [Pseudomonadota bacterium]